MSRQNNNIRTEPQMNPNPNSGPMPTNSRTNHRIPNMTMKRTIIALLYTLGVLLASSIAVEAATLLPPGKNCFNDANGDPLAAGSVGFYIPTTLTPKDTWTDAGETTLNIDPVPLDSAGCAIIYGNGTYRQIVKDSLGNTIWDQLTASTGNQTGVILYGGTSTGSANAQSITVTGFTATDGQLVSFIAGFTNTGATTIDAGTGGIAVRYDSPTGPVALVAGQIVQSDVITALYTGGFFHLIGPPPLASTILDQGKLFGLIISNDVSDATNDIDVTIGNAADNSTNVVMRLSAAIVKQLDAAWAVGTNQGCRDTGAISNAWWYIFLIERPDTNVADILCSLSATAPTLPTNYSLSRRIGAIFRTGGAIKAFTQVDDHFFWKVPIQDVATANPGTAAVISTLTIPPISVDADFWFALRDITPASNTIALITSPSQTNSVPSIVGPFSLFGPASGAGVEAITNTQVRLSTSNGTIRYRLDASTADTDIYINTNGWWDTREVSSP